jgi:hypothetical protein
MATFQNQSFTNTAVEVDGNRFEACVFTNCRLLYRGGELPNFVRCEFEGVNIQLEDGAYRTLDYLTALYKGGFTKQVEETLTVVERGEKPMPAYDRNVNAEATGTNYGQLAVLNLTLIVLTVGLIAGLWYGFIIYPDEEILAEGRPLRQEIPLDLMPALPDDLAVIYDDLDAGQRANLASYEWIDEANGIGSITIEDAMSIIAADDSLEAVPAEAEGEDPE